MLRNTFGEWWKYTFIPLCRAEPGPKCFVPKSSTEMSPYFWVMAVPGTWKADVLCWCLLLWLSMSDLVDAVTGHRFFLSPVLSLHSHSSSRWHPVVSAALSLFCPRCTATTWFVEGEIFHIHPSNPLHLNLFARRSLFCTYLYLSQSEKGLELPNS